MSWYWGKKKKGQAYSSYWLKRYDSYSYLYDLDDVRTEDFDSSATTTTKKADEHNYEEILRTIERSANVLSNISDKTGAERTLKVRWAKRGDVNTTHDNTVFISPTVVTASKWTKEERIDVLVAEALTESTLKRTIDPVIEDTVLALDKAHTVELETQFPELKIKTRSEAAALNQVWYVNERVNAERKVAGEYPGFKGYFAAHRDFYTTTTAKSKLAKALKTGAVDNSEDAVTVATYLQWRMLHPNTPLPCSERVKAVTDTCLEMAFDSDSSPERFDASRQAIRLIFDTFPAPLNEGSGKKRATSKGVGTPTSTRGTPVPAPAKDVPSEGETDTGPLKTVPSPSTVEACMTELPDDEIAFHPESGDAARYEELVRRLAPRIRSLKNALKLRAEIAEVYEHGLRRGTLDEGSLYKLGFHSLGYSDPLIFESREVLSLPQVAIGILVDQSGSMSGSRIAAAQALCVSLTEALRDLRGVELCVMGHTGQTRSVRGQAFGGLAMLHYYTPKNRDHRGLAAMACYAQNLDSYAIQRMAHHMRQWYPDQKRLLIHINDGLPEGSGYGGEPAMNHVNKVCTAARANGTQVLAVGIAGSWTDRVGRHMYGDGNFTVLNSPDAYPVVANLITKAVLRR